MSKLSEEIVSQIISLLEAEYQYNSVMSDIYQDGAPSIRKFNLALSERGSAFLDPDFFKTLKNDYSKNKEFYNGFLKRFEKESDQQKVLDDLFEQLRYDLFHITGIYADLDKNGVGSVVNEYSRKQSTESLSDIIEVIEPHISHFEKTFIKHYKLVYFNVHKVSYRSNLKQYVEEVLEELTKLELLYRDKNDEQGVQDIEKRKNKLSESNFMKLVAGVLYSIQENKELSEKEKNSEIRTDREICYKIYSLLEDARKIQRDRAQLIFAAPALSNGAIVNSPLQLQMQTPIEAESKLKKDRIPFASQPPSVKPESLVEQFSSFVSEADSEGAEVDSKQEKDRPPLSASSQKLPVKPENQLAQPVKQNSSSVSDAAMVPSPSSSDSEKLKARAVSAIQKFSTKIVDADSDALAKLEKKKKKLLFVKRRQEAQLRQSKEKKPVVPKVEKAISEDVLKVLGRPRNKVTLEQLFSQDPKVQIEESTLKSILVLMGGKINEKREAVRRQLSFKGRVGFVQNSESRVVKAHYHTNNERYAPPEVLAHWRDFFYRIGLTPHALWPAQYKKEAYCLSKTARLHAKAKR